MGWNMKDTQGFGRTEYKNHKAGSSEAVQIGATVGTPDCSAGLCSRVILDLAKGWVVKAEIQARETTREFAHHQIWMSYKPLTWTLSVTKDLRTKANAEVE